MYLIEDCSPFYIRFSFDNLNQIVDYTKSKENQLNYSMVFDKDSSASFSHLNLDPIVGKSIIEMLPFKNIFEFDVGRVAIFETPPRGGCGIHKDGSINKVSFNFIIEKHDDLCETTWYESNEDFRIKEQKGFSNLYSRNVFQNFRIMDKFYQPIKKLVAKENEMILFNTEIFHAWQNLQSSNTRKVLTLRIMDKSLYFEDVKKMIFS